MAIQTKIAQNVHLTCLKFVIAFTLKSNLSQSLQPVLQFTTVRSNYATASQCGLFITIYLMMKESNNMRIESMVDNRYCCSTFLRGVL
jgi:hypothetical protein